MAASYGFDVSRPGGDRAARRSSGSTSPTSAPSRSRTARRCRWAARRPSSTSTCSATSTRGASTEERAQELVDDFVIKLRIVRFLRTPEYDELFTGDPTWVTESIGGMGHDGRPLVTRTSLPLPADPLQPRPRARAEPDRALVARPAAAGSRSSARRCRSTPSAIQYESDELMRPTVRRRHRDRLLRVGDAGRQADAVLRRPGQPGQDPALRHQRRPRRGHRASRSARRPRRSTGEVLGLRRRRRPARRDDGLAGARPTSTRSTSSTTCTTSTPTSGWRWRCTTTRSDRTLACGIAGLSVAADSLSAIRYADGAAGARRRAAWSSTT